MKNTISILILTLALSLTACQKEESPVTNDTTGQSATPAFAGTYDLEVVTDSIGADGIWQSQEERDRETGTTTAPMRGTLTITATDDAGHYHLLGILLLGTSQTPVTYYDADAHLDADRRLVIENSTMTFPSGLTGHLTFGTATYGSPSFSFRSEMSVVISGTDCGYIFTNNCTKRAQ